MYVTVSLTDEPRVRWFVAHRDFLDKAGEFVSLRGETSNGETTLLTTVASARELRDALSSMLANVDAKADAERTREEVAA